jgi:hypothetical protein
VSEVEDRDRLRYLQLKAKAAQAASTSVPEPTPVVPEEPSRAESLLHGAEQGLTFGFGDEVNGGIQALIAKAMGDKQDFGELYRLNRDTFRREDASAEAAHPGYYLGGNLAGGLATAPLFPGGTGKTLGQLVLQGAKVGAGTGAAYGLGSSNADLTRGEFGRAAADTTLGGLMGGTLGAVIPAAAGGIGWMTRNVGAPAMKLFRGGYVTPTAEAKRLAERGVDNLTLGQMDPASPFGRIEELAATKVTGGSLAKARQGSASTARDVLIEAAGAPGAKPPTRGAPVTQQLEELRAGFSQVYDDALGGAKLQPEQYLGQGKWRGLLSDPNVQGAAKTKGAFELAADARDIDASPTVRRRALAWLTDKAEGLMPTRSGPDAGTVDASSVHALRTQLRDKLRNLGQEGDDRGLREIYGRAEEFVTELLEGQLPPERAAMLRGADESYRNLLSAEDAAKRAFVQNEEFTPAQLLQAIRNRGATPALEATARDAQAVFSARYPMTGVQVAANESIPLLNKVGPAWAAFANASPGFRGHALKELWTPGPITHALRATGRSLEGAARSSRATAPASRTLYDLLAQPKDEALPWAVSP